MARLGPYDTQQLTRQSLELSARRRLRGSAWLALAIAAGAAALLLAPRAGGLWPGGTATALRAENAALRAEVEHLRTGIELERAAHAELKAQLATLDGELAEANRQLDFLTARGVRAPARP